MSLYYRSLIEQGKLLDIYPNATVAYSLRKLRDTYTGSAIRVRRNVDSAEQDFGFDGSGNLDTTSIINFFGNNLLLQSENFGNASWTKLNSVITTGIILGPNGIDMADKLDENITSGVHTLTQASGSITNGANYFLSIYLRAGERNIVDVVSGIDGSSRVARVNLTTGTIVSNSFINTPTLTSAGSGWWKFEVIVTSAVTSVPTGLQVRLTNGSTQIYIGTTGWGCYIWGAQISGYLGSSIPYFKTTTVRASEASVTTYYDQSGNGNDLTNSSGSLQYRILLNGFIYRNSDNGLPSTFVISTGFYNLTTSISSSNPLVNFNVYKSTTANMILFGNNAGGRPVMCLHSGAAGSRVITTRLTSNSGQDFNLPFETNGSLITSTTRDTSNYAEVSVNNSIIGGSTLGTNTTADFTVVGRQSSSTIASGGEIQEMIIWKQDYVSLKSEISNKINEYYEIY
jgi:hypothetical protein